MIGGMPFGSELAGAETQCQNKGQVLIVNFSVLVNGHNPDSSCNRISYAGFMQLQSLTVQEYRMHPLRIDVRYYPSFEPATDH